MTRRTSTIRALTFMEALITLFLVGIVVVMLAALMSGMSKLGRRNRAGEQTVNGLAAFERVRAEAVEAITVIQPPAAAGFQSELKFEKIDPNATNRYPNFATSWTPQAPATLLTVRYREENRQLVRYSQAHAQAELKQVLADEVEGFSASWDGSSNVTLKISFQRGEVLEAHESSVRRYLP